MLFEGVTYIASQVHLLAFHSRHTFGITPASSKFAYTMKRPCNTYGLLFRWCTRALPLPGEWLHNQKISPYGGHGTPGNCDNELFFTKAVRKALGPLPTAAVDRVWGGACGTIASFCERATAATPRGRVKFHGLLPFPSRNAGIKPLAAGNPYRLALAAVGRGAKCNANIEHIIDSKCGNTRFIDQMSWLLPGSGAQRATAWEQALLGDLLGANQTMTQIDSHPEGWQRRACAAGDGHTPHIYDRVVIFLRVQSLLNSILGAVNLHGAWSPRHRIVGDKSSWYRSVDAALPG